VANIAPVVVSSPAKGLLGEVVGVKRGWAQSLQEPTAGVQQGAGVDNGESSVSSLLAVVHEGSHGPGTPATYQLHKVYRPSPDLRSVDEAL
jgi:hypothetical protein